MSNYKLFKKFVEEDKQQLYRDVKDYISATIKIQEQILNLRKQNELLEKQCKNKRATYQKILCEKFDVEYFTPIYFIKKDTPLFNNAYCGYNLFSNNAFKITKKNKKIITYLSLKLIFLDLMIDYIYINFVLEEIYTAYTTLEYVVNIHELNFKKFSFLYDILKERGIYINNDMLLCSHYKPYIRIYQILEHSYFIDLDNYILKARRKYEVYKLSIINCNNIYKQVDSFLFYIKKRIKLDRDINRLNNDFSKNFPCFSNYDNILSDLSNDFSYDIGEIKNLAMECKGYY